MCVCVCACWPKRRWLAKHLHSTNKAKSAWLSLRPNANERQLIKYIFLFYRCNFLNLNYKKINDCGLTFFRTTLSLAVIKVSPEAAGGLPESSPGEKKKQLQEMKRSGIFLLNSRLLFKTVFKKIKTSIWLVDDIYVNRAEPRLEFWARVCCPWRF